MDFKGINKKAATFFGKYRYVLLIILVGMVLMCIPSFSEEETSEPVMETQKDQQPDLEAELEQILKLIDGVGDVKVILTIAETERTLYQYDENVGQQDTYDRDTVILTDSDREQSGLVTGVIGPKYRGAVVVCNGADRASVKLSIMEAVAAATGLGMDKISVLKMK